MLCAHKLSYVLYSADWLNWGLENYNWFSAVYCQISSEGYQTICVLDPFHLQKGQQAFESIYKPVYTVRITQKEHLLIWNSETTQNLNIYLYNYQTETAIVLATKHEENSYGMQLFYFFKYFLHSSFKWVPKWSEREGFFLHLTCGGNVNYYKSVHHPIPILPVGTGNTLAIFKTNH